MGLLKDLYCGLVDLLEATSKRCISNVDEEFLCCCERARHAIKEFTNQGDDGKVSDCLPVAGDALCDLQWCFHKICPGWLSRYQAENETRSCSIWRVVAGFGTRFHPGKSCLKSIEIDLPPRDDIRISYTEFLRVYSPLASVLRYRDKSLLRRFFRIERVLFPFVRERKTFISYSSDARNGRGSAHLPPGLNVDDLGEIEYISALGEGSQGTVYKAVWGRRSAHLPPIKLHHVDDLAGGAEFLSESGRSGVYEACRGQLVAVKEVFSETQCEGLAALESLVRSSAASVSRSYLDCELDVLKTLNHPNIVELKGYTRKPRAGKYGLVMELMKCSLQDLIKSETLSHLVKVDTLLQVARGMHFLHSVAGIMHRDLKPANILIGELNYLPPDARRLRYVVAKIADFGLSKGLSKQVDGADRHTFKQGTRFYMAPELHKSCKDHPEYAWYAKSADVFSFGTTCFNVLTGEETPCTEASEFYAMIKRRDLDQWLQKCGPSQMRLLVRQCWCPEPNSRPPFVKICQILEKEKRRILEEEKLGSAAGALSTL